MISKKYINDTWHLYPYVDCHRFSGSSLGKCSWRVFDKSHRLYGVCFLNIRRTFSWFVNDKNLWDFKGTEK